MIQEIMRVYLTIQQLKQQKIKKVVLKKGTQMKIQPQI